jgi:DNA-binding beta-propeller fold protein YncE
VPIRVAVVAGMLAVAGGVVSIHSSPPAALNIPTFEYDASWPKPLPNNWTTGNIGAISIDSKQHIWIAHRPHTTTGLFEQYGLTGEAECCSPAPPVLEFDQAGNLLHGWGPIHGPKGELLGKQVWGPHPEVEWPANEHGIFVDDHYVWLSNSFAPSQILKFTRDGKLVARFGKTEAKTSADQTNMAGPTQMTVDPSTNELYVADGYRNRRVLVLDAQTGAYKRSWGAYGHKPADPQGMASIEGGPEYEQSITKGGMYTPFWLSTPGKRSQEFATVHCLAISRDRLVYVCDRFNNRLQVFRTDGTFVQEQVVRLETLGSGSVYAIDFSPDQEFVYVADGTNKKIWILRRKDLAVLGSFGSGGRGGGQFMVIHAMVTDAKGNIYVGETVDNNRVQRFNFKGMKPTPARQQ